MKVAVPVFRSRISPVFDVAHLCLLVELENGTELRRMDVPLHGKMPAERIGALEQVGTEVLICGGITGVTRFLAERAGIRLHAGCAGEVEEILRAFAEGRLDEPCFRMPGCPRRRRRRGRRT
jgi:predicted Fe-Mo cluster-binding NifX family protein